MGNIVDTSVNRKSGAWIRPWQVEKFDDLYNRDERFFAIIIKGALSFLNRKMLMYNKSIKHFIYNTGSSYMYVENNGYEFSWNETSGEDYMYMQLPRCITEIGNITVDMAELTQGFARGNYERKNNNVIQGYNSEIKRIPIDLTLTLHYVLSNFNECMILIQELIDTLVFQKYFKISYLGQIIQCSIELPSDFNIQLNKIDLAAADMTQRMIDVSVKICANYPLINEHSEISTAHTIAKFMGYLENQKGRDNDLVIMVDGKDITDNDIFLDLRKFDFNGDGKLDENEILWIENFINDFDLDVDGEVTQHDLSIIEEEFLNNSYNIKYDILNKGTVDKDNLTAIYDLFNTLDFNNDNVVSQYELDAIKYIIKHIDIFDFDNNLIIDYADFSNLISYVKNHLNMTYNQLYAEFIEFFNQYINITEMLQEILDILKSGNFKDILLWLDSCKYKDEIDLEIFNKLREYLQELLLFLLYDLGNDKVITNDDIDVFVNIISDYTGQQITYYATSSIIIHQNDHSLSKDSITDVIPLQNLSNEYDEE